MDHLDWFGGNAIAKLAERLAPHNYPRPDQALNTRAPLPKTILEGTHFGGREAGGSARMQWRKALQPYAMAKDAILDRRQELDLRDLAWSNFADVLIENDKVCVFADFDRTDLVTRHPILAGLQELLRQLEVKPLGNAFATARLSN